MLGWLFFPVAWLMGVPLADCAFVGELLGTKLASNEVRFAPLLTGGLPACLR